MIAARLSITHGKKKGANLSTRVRGKRRRNPLHLYRLVHTLLGKLYRDALRTLTLRLRRELYPFFKKTVSYAFFFERE